MISDASLAALLEGAEPAAGAAPQLRPLAKALADLTDRPASDELGGEAETLAAFRSQVRAEGPAHRRPQPRRQLLPRSVAARIAVAAGAVALSLAGLTTAAYAGALPAPVQRLAHDIIGAPAPRSRPGSRPYPAAPVATHPSTGPSRRTHPAPDSDGRGKRSSHPAPHGHGKPSAHPAPHGDGDGDGDGKPSAHPAPHGHGKPTSHPAPRGHGKPGSHLAPRGHGKPS